MLDGNIFWGRMRVPQKNLIVHLLVLEKTHMILINKRLFCWLLHLEKLKCRRNRRLELIDLYSFTEIKN